MNIFITQTGANATATIKIKRENLETLADKRSLRAEKTVIICDIDGEPKYIQGGVYVTDKKPINPRILPKESSRLEDFEAYITLSQLRELLAGRAEVIGTSNYQTVLRVLFSMYEETDRTMPRRTIE
jgi:hypothetical protein